MFDLETALAEVRAEKATKDKVARDLAEKRNQAMSGLAHSINAFRDKYNIPADVSHQDGSVRIAFDRKGGLDIKYMNDGTFTASKTASAISSGSGPRVTDNLDEKSIAKFIVKWLIETHEN